VTVQNGVARRRLRRMPLGERSVEAVRTVAWTPEQAQRIRLGPDNTAPIFDPSTLPKTFPGRLVWDFWPVRLRSGDLVSFGDRTIWMALSVTDDTEPESRHAVAEIHAAVVDREGRWSYAGPVFPAGTGRGSRQWAGCAVYDPVTGEIVVYYSAAGTIDQPESYEQEIVVARGEMRFSDGRLHLSGWSEHSIALVADEAHYRGTSRGSQRPGFADAFRDPSHFNEPRSGRDYLLFMGTMGSAATEFDGSVGIAETAGGHRDWRLLPPLITADGVNKELERPHLVARDGHYYLFFSSHSSNFASGIVGPEGLYGFVSEHVLGPYRPLNDAGLVLANPPEEPHQAYSWTVMDNGDVHSFADYPGLGRFQMGDDLALRAAHFSGRVAPTVRLQFDGGSTRVISSRPGHGVPP
jgi:levansucrase